jgi:hypothetical protein
MYGNRFMKKLGKGTAFVFAFIFDYLSQAAFAWEVRGWERLPLHKDYFAKGILWKKTTLFDVVLFGYTLPIKASVPATQRKENLRER